MTRPVALLCLFLSVSPPANQPVNPQLPTESYCYSAYEVMLPDSVDFPLLLKDAQLTDVIVAPLLYISLRFETTNPRYRQVYVYFMNLVDNQSDYIGLQHATVAMLGGDYDPYPRVTFARSTWINQQFSFDFNDDLFTLHRRTYSQVTFNCPRLVRYVELRRVETHQSP